jgi:hypothetical protein
MVTISAAGRNMAAVETLPGSFYHYASLSVPVTFGRLSCMITVDTAAPFITPLQQNPLNWIDRSEIQCRAH